MLYATGSALLDQEQFGKEIETEKQQPSKRCVMAMTLARPIFWQCKCLALLLKLW